MCIASLAGFGMSLAEEAEKSGQWLPPVAAVTSRECRRSLTNAAEGRDFHDARADRGTGRSRRSEPAKGSNPTSAENLRWSKSRPTLISRSAIFHAHFESPPACRRTSGFFASALEIAK
jgi:hypothetical protein